MGTKTAEAKTCTILVVDDDAAMRSLLVDELREEGFQVMEATNGKEALSQVGLFTPDLIITDLKMPFGDFDYLRRLKAAVPTCPVILITGTPRRKRLSGSWGFLFIWRSQCALPISR